MAWKWFDLAELDEWNNWEKAWRVCAIRTKIGRELRGQFELPQEMPPPILALLAEIDATTTTDKADPRSAYRLRTQRPVSAF